MLGSRDARQLGFGGWMFSPQGMRDDNRRVYHTGDGRRVAVGASAQIVAGNGTGSALDGAPAVGAQLPLTYRGMAVAPSGKVFWIESRGIRSVEGGVLALDTETTSLDLSRARLVGICLAVTPGEGFYVPLAHVDEFGQPRPGQLDLPAVIERLKPVLVDPAVLKIGHNIKYDQGMLARYGLDVTPADDTMLISYVLHGASHGHGMDELALRHLTHKCIPVKEVAGSGRSMITSPYSWMMIGT